MCDLVVKPVTSSRDKRRFLTLPWKLYRDDPNWIPPLRLDQKELVGYKPHPFYERNEIQTFLALRSGEVCGRIAAILNRCHNEHYSERRGFFGFFECVDDQQVADRLFDAVGAWLAERDIHSLRGPTNPSLHYTVGLLIEGFDSPPTFMMTYNPEYYPRLVEGYGFRKAHDLYAYWGQREWLPSRIEKYRPISEQIIERYDVKLRTLNKSRFLEDIRAFLSIFNESLVGSWGFVPMSDGEIRHAARGLRHLLVPELAVAAEIDGKLVGMALALPHYDPRIKAIDGRRLPFGFLRLLLGRKKIRRTRLISANVLPAYHRLGIGLVMADGMVLRVIDWGFQEAEFSWVLESNSLSRGSLEKGGAVRTKTYRLYDLDE